MWNFSSMLQGLARSLSGNKGRKRDGEDAGRHAADVLRKGAKKNELIRRSSGSLRCDSSKCFASVFSRRGNKGINQDCLVVWEEFGGQEDMIFCGVFDGHGPWGHLVAKRVRESLPSSLLCNWQEFLGASLDSGFDIKIDKKVYLFDLWKQSYFRTCAIIDRELELDHGVDSFYSGTTALTVVKQGELIFIANVGDSRAVLATTSDGGSLVPVQLTIDFKPTLPQEAERIKECNGRVFCLQDEPGVHRVWLPDGETPGLAMSRAFGDYCIKEFGLISVPEVTHRHITNKDRFIILATDGVWDVISNEEAVDIVSSTPDKAKSAKRLVECAARAWKSKRQGIAKDDCSAVCLFFHFP